MRIKFQAPDPRAGAIAQMDSRRGLQLIDAGSAVQVRDDDTEVVVVESKAITTASTAPQAPSAKPSEGLKVDEIKAALQAKGIAIPEGVTLKADLAALLDGAAAQ